jgi:hypothetical protein
MSGFTGGFYGGCQVQLGVWVVGAEGDWSLNNQAGQAFGGWNMRCPTTGRSGANISIWNGEIPLLTLAS